MFEKPLIQFFPSKKSHSDCIFSILIPSWNNLPYLQTCIHSIQKNSKFKHQILVHVNEGTDGTLEWVKEQNLDYTFSARNAGVCCALNALANLVQTEYILYLNDDMFVCEAWDQHLYDAIQLKTDNLFYFSGTMIEFETSSSKAVLSPHDFGKDLKTFDEEGLKDFVKNTRNPDWFGACWPPSIVSKSLWNQVGGYSEAYSPGFYSDPDFAMKLWKMGVRDFRGIGACLVYHFKCKSTGRVTKNNGRKTFAQTWGIPSSFFYKNVLKMGATYSPSSQLAMPGGLTYLAAKLRAWWISIS